MLTVDEEFRNFCGDYRASKGEKNNEEGLKLNIQNVKLRSFTFFVFNSLCFILRQAGRFYSERSKCLIQ